MLVSLAWALNVGSLQICDEWLHACMLTNVCDNPSAVVRVLLLWQ